MAPKPLTDRIREALKPYLEPDEELRSVGQFRSGSLLLGLLFMKYWYVGITKKRVIFVRLTALSKPDENVRFATPLNNVKLDGERIAVITPEEGMPQKFAFHYGVGGVTDLDKGGFKAALATQETV